MEKLWDLTKRRIPVTLPSGKNEGLIMTREKILDELWDSNKDFVDDNTLSVYIRRLRNKIEDIPNAPKYLLTERGIGYKWVVE